MTACWISLNIIQPLDTSKVYVDDTRKQINNFVTVFRLSTIHVPLQRQKSSLLFDGGEVQKNNRL